MIMSSKSLIFMICLFFFAGSTLTAQDYDYIGAAKCKMCHNKAATGQQYKIWSEGPHANAMNSLSSEKAMAIAAEKGIADPTTDASCISCHSTAGGTDEGLHVGLKMDEGVSCETCHGPGSGYKSNTVMKSREKSIENGLIVPDEKLCRTCHNEKSPTFKGFNYEESLKKIAHPNPAAE